MEKPLCKCGCGASCGWDYRHNRWLAYLPGHYRKDAPYKSSDWLRDQYENRGMSTIQLAASCSVSKQTILKFMKKYGIERRRGTNAHVGRHVGDKNPAWKGGVTPERQRLYKSPEWKSLLSFVFERDGYGCVRCNAGKTRQRAIHAHHVRPWADAPELRMEADNLITLCNDCHRWVHSKANLFGELLLAA